MRFGINYITSVYNDARKDIVMRTLPSLIKTNVEGLEKPVLRFNHSTSFDYSLYVEQLQQKFELDMRPDTLSGFTAILQDGANTLLEEHPDVTHISFMCDDSLCNSEWLQQLDQLIQRRPDGIAWAVYRSSLTYYHQILGTEGDDVRMSMHDGIGCVTREEWQEYMKGGFMPCPDIYHASNRPGNRWATGRDYIENLGVHPEYGRLDQAIDFVGE